MLKDHLLIRPDLVQALQESQPIVALESTIIAHGLPRPHNLSCAKQLEAVVHAAGALPATIGITGGRIKIGLTEEELAYFAESDTIAKVSRRDLAAVLASGGDGATTVAATMICAALAGIKVFATGGIGGVHRGAENTMDISADLTEFGRTPVAVVCAGAKSILDLPKTLEFLETQGVPVLGFGTDFFPAFYSRSSGLRLEYRVDSAAAAARIIATHQALQLGGGIVVAAPIPQPQALAQAQVEAWIETALGDAQTTGINGKALTPFLLSRLGDLSAGNVLQANIALVENNAAIAAAIATALTTLNHES